VAGYYDYQGFTVALPGNLAPGTYYIGGIADYNNQISETNDSNNNYNAVAITVAPSSSFDIVIDFSGDAAYQSYFDAAAARWEQVITGDLPGVFDSTYGSIDDLLINASVVPIDGAGGILGQAGPDRFRSGSLLPYHGAMQFDSADLASMAANGTLSYVILHEMGHILGIGTIWSSLGLRNGFQYTGADALAQYRAVSGDASATYVPLESGGGSGTAGSHWSESVFGNELMTGYISGTPDPLSVITIGSLQDMGYQVNYGAADPYTMPGHLQGLAMGSSDSDLPGIMEVGDTLMFVDSMNSGTAAHGGLADAWNDLVGLGPQDPNANSWLPDDKFKGLPQDALTAVPGFEKLGMLGVAQDFSPQPNHLILA
jgi:hypothetical protein